MAQTHQRMFFAAVLAGMLLLSFAGAHEGDSEDTASAFGSLSNPLMYLGITALWTIALIILALLKQKSLTETHKKLLFAGIALPILAASLGLIISTVVNNATSVTRGPVHWHADYEVWVCGVQYELRDPEFLSNRIGNAMVHEHNDNRIHIEGTLKELHDASLEKYFGSIGGKLAPDELMFPAAEKMLSVKNSDLCNNQPASLKVYVNGKRVDAPEEYVPYPSSYVPPGDCIIVAFDESTAAETDKVCKSWKVSGASYETFRRPAISIGETTWQ